MKNKPLNVVIDLDNTLFYNDIVDNACSDYGIERTKRHDLADLPEEVQKTCRENFKNVNMMCSLKPFPKAIGIDKIVTDKGHKVIVVSSRSHILYPATVKMVLKHFPHVDDVVLIESFDKKQAYIDLKADIVVDDHSDHIFQAIDAGVRYVAMVSTEKTLYNHDFKDSVMQKGVNVVDSVNFLEEFCEIYETIDGVIHEVRYDNFLFAGSFNPYTIGHHSVYENATNILRNNTIIVGVAQNSNKDMINAQLLKWRMNPAFPYFMSTNVKVVDEPMLADYAVKAGCDTIIRSLRNSIDLVHETDLAVWNRYFGVETIFVPAEKSFDHVSSSYIREIHSLGKDMRDFFVNDTQYFRYKNKKPERIIVVGRMGSGKSSFIKDIFPGVHNSVDMDQIVKNALKNDTREKFKTFFDETDVLDIAQEWDSTSMAKAKDEVVDIIDNEWSVRSPRPIVYECSAFTAYDRLKPYYDDSVIIYVDNYSNGTQREIDNDFMLKSLQLQHIPNVIDFVINQDNGKLDDVVRDIKSLIYDVWQ